MNLLQFNKRFIPGSVLTIILISIITCSVSLKAQTISTPLQPEQFKTQKEFGFFAGIGSNTQSGTLLVDCPDCRFEGGAKFGYTLGMLYEFDLFHDFMLGASLSFEDKSIQSQFQEYESITISNKANNFSETLPLLFQHTADVKINTLSITPYLKYNVFSFLFIRSGLSISLPFVKTLSHTKESLDQTIKLSDGEIVKVSNYTNTKIQDGDIPNANVPLFSLPVALGFNIPLANNVALSPIFQYNFDLNNISDKSDNLKINSFYFLLELRIAINKRFSM